MKHANPNPANQVDFFALISRLFNHLGTQAESGLLYPSIVDGVVDSNVSVADLLQFEASNRLPALNRFMNRYQPLWQKLCMRDFGFGEKPEEWGKSWRGIYAWHSYYFRRALRALMRNAWKTQEAFDWNDFTVDGVSYDLHMLPYKSPGSIYYVYCDIPNRGRRYFDANHLFGGFFHVNEIDADGFMHRKDALYHVIELEGEGVSEDPVENAYRSWYAEKHTEIISGVYTEDWKTILATLPEFPESENGVLLVGVCQTCHYDRAALECRKTGTVYCDSLCQLRDNK